MVAFHWLDWIVLGLFGLGLAAIVVYVTLLKDETDEDYFLAGRNAGWLVIGASIFASNIGSEHLIGLAGAGAESGMAMAHWEMHSWLILILGWVFVPFYDRAKVFTMPEFLERRYDSRSRTVLSTISIVSYVLTKVSVTVYAGGIVFQNVLGIETLAGINFFWISAIGLVIITGIYTILGGMKSVLYTSVLQTPILLIGSITILIVGLVKLGGWGELERIVGNTMTQHGDSMLDLIRSPESANFPWTGVLFASPLIGFWYWCTDQYIVQRVLSGANQKQSRRGAIFGGYLKLLPVFIFLVPGMIAFALNQKGLINLPTADAAFPTLVRELLPIGLKGLVVGGLLAALMSSLSSLFNSSAALFTEDFYRKWKPNKPEKHYVVVGRIATAVIVVLGIVWIPVMRSMGDVLYKYLQNVQALLAPGIASVFLLGVFTVRTNNRGGFWGLLVPFGLGMTRLFLVIFNIPETSILYEIFVSHNIWHYSIYLFIIGLSTTWIISILTEKPTEEKVKSLTFYTGSEEEKRITKESWNGWDVFNTIVIVGVIIAFYAYFW